MSDWQVVFDFLLSLGFAEAVLRRTCITPEESLKIADVIKRRQPRRILEIGTFVGLSTGVIALARPTSGSLVCVDPNLPADIHSTAVNAVRHMSGSLAIVRQVLEHIRQADNTTLLEGFFSCPPQADLQHMLKRGVDLPRIGIIGERIREYGTFDVVFLDGDHYADAVYSDLTLICHHLSPSGIIVLHDMVGKWADQVHTGVRRFRFEHDEFGFIQDDNLGFLTS